jgi:hypothetical protein
MGHTLQGKDCRVKRKRYPRKFQRMAMQRMGRCEDVDELANELGVTRRCLYKWRAKHDLVEPGEDSVRPARLKRPTVNSKTAWSGFWQRNAGSGFF